MVVIRTVNGVPMFKPRTSVRPKLLVLKNPSDRRDNNARFRNLTEDLQAWLRACAIWKPLLEQPSPVNLVEVQGAGWQDPAFMWDLQTLWLLVCLSVPRCVFVTSRHQCQNMYRSFLQVLAGLGQARRVPSLQRMRTNMSAVRGLHSHHC